ncbi:MAG: multicopper oxidase family protein [Oscillatoriales cyanobacterium RU_3_3]|nr:multicopper oxidase family protein [Microcoleus sp. SU_5_3]NJM61575.1 multicopper oxidase family protein [Oscillatoriales cyanobacterium RU_3_3]
MSLEEPIVADLARLESMSKITPGIPVPIRQFAQWDGIALAHCYHPCCELPEHQWKHHLIGIGGTGSPATVEHRIGGKFHQHSYHSHEIMIIPARVSYSAFWQQEHEFSMLGMNPSFLEKIARESVKATQIELIPQFITIDPLIQQILLALHGDMIAGHPTGHLFGESLAIALGYNETVPGATLRLQEGDRVRLTFTNHLDVPTNLHTHGLHISPEVDNPFVLVMPGESRLHEFTLPKGSAGTRWYHPHPHGEVATQQFAGLSGAIVIESPLDKIPELKAAEEHLLIFKDFTISKGRVDADHSLLDWFGKYGDLPLVNGAYQPQLVAQKATLRLRLLNASNARSYLLKLEDIPLNLIATDDGFIEKPILLKELLLTPGERAEVMVQLDRSGSFSLLNLADNSQNIGREMPEPLLTIVAPDNPQPTPLPKRLATVEEIDLSKVTQTRKFKFGGTAPFSYTIDGRTFNMDRIDARVKVNTLEIWEIENATHLIHPFHLHTYPFQILARQTAQSDLWQPEPFRAWRDNINLPAKEKVRIVIPFRDITGRTVFHCHISEHEDRGMMGVIEVTS